MRIVLQTIIIAGALLTSPTATQGAEKSLLDQFNNLVGKYLPGTQLERVQRETTAPANPYDRFLYEGYLALSQTEYDEGDYQDSDLFAIRAETAASGRRFKPENVTTRDLPEDVLNLAARNRGRLMVAYLRGAAAIKPKDAADAQLSFDCWMQEQEEDFQIDDIADCIERFDLAMSNIDIVLNPTAIPEPTADAPPRAVFEVFFGFDKADITAESRKIVDAFAQWTKAYGAPYVSVIGNADQVGSTDYNLALSERRAESVAAELRKLNVEVANVFARGDQAPAVDREDRGPEDLNRRVLMVVRNK